MRVAVAVAVVWIAGCSPMNTVLGGTDAGYDAGYDAGPTVPLKPHVMLLIDKSGSMNFAANDQLAPCTPGCNTPGNAVCAGGCRTRLQELKTAMASFLPAKGSVAWLGLAIFPTAVVGSTGVINACGPTTSGDIRVQLTSSISDLASEMNARADLVNAEIQQLPVGGGTPTGDSLKFMGTYAALLDLDAGQPRNSFVVLITDGVPNCNPQNANNCSDAAACKCTLVPANACTPSSFCTQGCLDADNSTAQITALRQKNIKTIVIGFGADTAAGDAYETLNAMAVAGSFARTCPGNTDAECGASGTCNLTTRFCDRKYYQASSASELLAVLNDIFRTQ